ncbi:MAG: hypothetical protein WAN81_03250 [Candidatus Binataceae bacterium]
MRQIIELRTKDGGRVSIVLEHWGSGLDYALRRWVLIDGYWKCTDTGDIADECRLAGVKIFNPSHPLPGLR